MLLRVRTRSPMTLRNAPSFIWKRCPDHGAHIDCCSIRTRTTRPTSWADMCASDLRSSPAYAEGRVNPGKRGNVGGDPEGMPAGRFRTSAAQSRR